MSIEQETIDPASVPKATLYTGAQIPMVGLGTFGSDRFTAEDIADAVTYLLNLSDKASVDQIYIRRRNSSPF